MKFPGKLITRENDNYAVERELTTGRAVTYYFYLLLSCCTQLSRRHLPLMNSHMAHKFICKFVSRFLFGLLHGSLLLRRVTKPVFRLPAHRKVSYPITHSFFFYYLYFLHA